MQLPVLGIDETGDVDIFNSVADAESYIEWQDIADWKVYTADGMVVRLSVIKGTGWLGELEPIRVRLAPTDEPAVDELRAAIIRFLQLRGYERDQTEPVDSLVRFLVSVERPRV